MSLLSTISTRAPKELEKKETKEKAAELLKKLNALQNVLYAESNHAVLVILQGLDGSGKDGAIRNVFGKLNPQGVRVASFKTPTEEEKKHDFLWRVHLQAPQKGMIQLFNRSHYEDVLITRVHGWCDDKMAKKRFEAINAFENLLSQHNQTSIFKFYLHVSAEEQQERLQERIDNPEKHWKYNKADFAEAGLRSRYQQVYEDIFENCNRIPWTIVPADQNWYKEFLIAKTVVEGLTALHLKYPDLQDKSSRV